MIIHTDSLWIHFEENSVDIYLSRMDNCTMAFALQEFSLSVDVIFKSSLECVSLPHLLISAHGKFPIKQMGFSGKQLQVLL